MLTGVLILIGAITYLVWGYLNNKKYAGMQKIPGPKPLPILGNVLDFGRNIHEVFNNQIRLWKKYGSIFKIWIGPRLVVVISDPDKLEKILSSNINIRKSNLYDDAKDRMGEGLLTSNGHTWKSHRKLLTPAFHFKMVKEFVPQINKNLDILINILEEASTKGPLNLLKYYNLYTLDVISEIAMMTNIEAQTNSENEYVVANKIFLDTIIERNFSFFAKFDHLFKFSSSYKKRMAVVKTLRKLPSSVIESRRMQRKSGENIEEVVELEVGEKMKKYFIDILLDLQEEGKFQEKDIFDEVETFMFAGHDTLSSTISFASYALAKHQIVQEKIYQELIENLGSDPNVEVTYNDIQNLTYLDMFLKETLRLYTIAPFIERVLNEPVVFDDVTIPEGTTIQVYVWGVHHDPKHYPEPEKFDPERFLPENTRTRHPFAYIPFSAGPRNCIGQKYAMMAAKVSIAKMLMNLKFEVADNFEPKLTSHGILSSVNGIQVKLTKRNSLIY